MKLKFIKIVVIVIAFSSFNKQSTSKPLEKSITVDETANAEGLKLIKQNCYACHSVTSKSHDEIIAPPMIAVKNRYSIKYNNKKDFVNAVVAFVSDPKAENALMIGAVDKFNVMQKLAFKEEDLRKIASYIYDNEIEKPEWFKSQFK
jgi:mono/diheme cytochrome c family protein